MNVYMHPAVRRTLQRRSFGMLNECDGRIPAHGVCSTIKFSIERVNVVLRFCMIYLRWRRVKNFSNLQYHRVNKIFQTFPGRMFMKMVNVSVILEGRIAMDSVAKLPWISRWLRERVDSWKGVSLVLITRLVRKQKRELSVNDIFNIYDATGDTNNDKSTRFESSTVARPGHRTSLDFSSISNGRILGYFPILRRRNFARDIFLKITSEIIYSFPLVHGQLKQSIKEVANVLWWFFFTI